MCAGCYFYGDARSKSSKHRPHREIRICHGTYHQPEASSAVARGSVFKVFPRRDWGLPGPRRSVTCPRNRYRPVARRELGGADCDGAHADGVSPSPARETTPAEQTRMRDERWPPVHRSTEKLPSIASMHDGSERRSNSEHLLRGRRSSPRTSRRRRTTLSRQREPSPRRERRPYGLCASRNTRRVQLLCNVPPEIGRGQVTPPLR